METKNKVLRLLLSIFLFAAISFLWGNAIYDGQLIRCHYPSVSVRLDQEKITKRSLLQAIDREREKGSSSLQSISAWNMLNKQTISNDELNTQVKVNLITSFGDMNTVYPVELAEGSIPAMDDYAGCLIDLKTSYALFRTAHPIGNRLTFEEKSYCIRGIIDTEVPVCMIQKEDENDTYANLELTYSDIENGALTVGTFLLQNGISETSILEGSFYATILERLILLPAWLLAITLLFPLLKELWRRRTLPLQALIITVLIAVGWLMLRWSLELAIFIPQRLIPTSWSDFGFWSRRICEWKEFRKSLAYLYPYPKDVILFQIIRRCLTSLFAVVIGIILLFLHNKDLLDDLRPGLLLGASLTAEVIALLLLSWNGHLTRFPRAWFLLPLLLFGNYWIRKLQERLKND